MRGRREAEIHPSDTIANYVTVSFLAAAWLAEEVRRGKTRMRLPVLTLAVCGLLVVCLLAQLRFPSLLTTFERDRAQIFAGQWWRMLTTFFFQDGWLAGGISNIAVLFWIGNAVEQARERWYWVTVSLTGALLAGVVALWWQPVGAGNSVATCSLAGSLITGQSFAQAPVPANAFRVVAVLLVSYLLAARNIHGVAGAVGIFLGLALAQRGLCEVA